MKAIIHVLNFIISYLIRLNKWNAGIMESFAKKNNFSFIDLEEKEIWLNIVKHGTPEEIANYTFYLFSKRFYKEGDFCRSVFNNIKGSYKGRKIEIYNYQHESLVYIVFEIETKNILPLVIITENRSSLIPFLEKESFVDFAIPENLETESNEFDRSFKIFLRRNHDNREEISLLRILTPDVMAKLIDEEKREEGKDIHIEFSHNKVILYKRIRIFSRELSEGDIQRLLDLASEIAEEAEK